MAYFHQAMTLTVDIPDDLAADLGAGFQNLSHAALDTACFVSLSLTL
jgi:hypothetical protein